MELSVPVQNPWGENEIKTGRAAIYVYGRITYRDILKTDRFTDFRLICRGENLAKGRLAPDTSGNDAD